MIARLGNGLTLILALGCGGAYWTLDALQQDESLGVPTAAVDPVTPASDPDLPAVVAPARNIEARRPFVDTELLLARPLFTDGRRPAEVASEQTEVTNTVVMMPLNYVLEGVVSAGERSAVLLRSSQGQTRRNLRVDETLDGWKLLRVDAQQAEFGRDSQRLVLELEIEFERGATAVEWQRIDRAGGGQ